MSILTCFQASASVVSHDPPVVQRGQSRLAVPPPSVPAINMTQYLIRGARTFIGVIRRSACHFSSNIIWRVTWIHDTVPDNANVMSFGFAHKVLRERKLTTITNSGTTRNSINAAHLRRTSFCLAISFLRWPKEGYADTRCLACRSWQLLAGDNQIGRRCSHIGSGSRSRAGNRHLTSPSGSDRAWWSALNLTRNGQFCPCCR